jgi:hypothetical protein
MLHCIKIKEKFCALHDEKGSSLDKPIMSIWRMASALKASIERRIAADFHLA